MSRWLNLNESLTSLKGQISNFANNVLAETDEGAGPTDASYEELKTLYIQKEREIENLKKINEELQKSLRINGNQNGETGYRNWEWTSPDLTVNDTTPENTKENSDAEVSHLEQLIKQLEGDKKDLLNQLDQLDAENQQNLSELMNIRDHLQQENDDLKEKCQQLTQQNKSIAVREDTLNGEIRELREKLKDQSNQDLKVKLDEAMKELTVLKSTHETLQRTLQDTRSCAEKEQIELEEKLRKTEMENKIIHGELQKAKEAALLSAKKIQEDADNCQKLAFILESYENEVSSLKHELETIKNKRNKEKSEVKNTEALEKANQELQTKLDEALDRIDSLEKERDQSNQDCDSIISTLTAMQTKLVEALDRIKGLEKERDESNEHYETIISTLKAESEDLKKELQNKLSELNDIKQEMEMSSNDHHLEEIEALNKKIAEISSEKENLRKLDVENKETNNGKNTDALKKAHQELQRKLDEALDRIDILGKERDESNEHYETIISTLKAESEDSKKELQNKLLELNDTKQEMDHLLEEIEALNKKIAEMSSEKENLHKVYVNIITDNVKRYIDSDIIPSIHYENPHALEFGKQVQDIFEILVDYKRKCELFEKDIMKISQEKTKLLNEKNDEIEKLLQNSELLSQDIINKTETIKELETEISNLMTTNDVLMSELDSYKNSGLQTISESNEDNMVLLETDLENANKKIRELEKIIDNSGTKSVTSRDSSTTSLEGRISEKLEDYQELLNSFDELRMDYDCSKRDLRSCQTENEDLKSQLEKIKADYENVEYQLSEASISVEELELSRVKLDELAQENKELKLQNMHNIDMKSELNEVREKWLTETNSRRHLEAEVKNLQEKLQNSKVNETSLKLQFDTLNKEHAVTVEAKNNLQKALSAAQESVAEYERNYTQLLQKYDGVLLRCEELNTQLHEKENSLLKLQHDSSMDREEKQELEKLLEEKSEQLQKYLERESSVEEQSNRIRDLEDRVDELSKALTDEKEKNSVIEKQSHENNRCTSQTQTDDTETLGKNQESLQQKLNELIASRNELINMVTVKHQESINYHNEIQRLTHILTNESQKCSQLEAQLLQASNASQEIAKKSEENDKLRDENNFLKEKCDILTKNLLEEQAKVERALAENSAPSEKEVALTRKLERLQGHLMELEEHYTQELLDAEQKKSDLQAKLANLEQREKNSSTLYTSVSIRANQQVETLQTQLQLVTNQRDELRRKISDAEDANNKQAAALANLQFVLEQFQKDKEKDVLKETERIRREIKAEKQVQENLRNEIGILKEQLEESRVGLQAASRLSDQLEAVKKLNSGLKEEVSQLQQKLAKSQEKINDLTSQTDGKIDKSLIKNLVVGLLSSSNSHNWNKDQFQIIKIIATVLDFNQQDHDKVKINQPQQGSWLGSILFPQGGNQNMSQESLSLAFIKFLENESKPRDVPSLLSDQSHRPGGSTESSKRNTPRASPIVLNDIVLPTFADFGHSRNSSSILKDVLKDNNNS